MAAHFHYWVSCFGCLLSQRHREASFFRQVMLLYRGSVFEKPLMLRCNFLTPVAKEEGRWFVSIKVREPFNTAGRGAALEKRRRIVAWVTANVMPYEGTVRAWLQQSMVSAEDIDDLIQEAYCKLAGLDAVDHIESPHAYFFQIVRNLLTDQLRRARVVRIETVGELGVLSVSSEDPSPERAAAARRELEKVRRLIAGLPPRCRQVFELRKIDGVPQREIARRLGLSESTVENEGVRGMRLIMEALRKEQVEASEVRKMCGENGQPRKLKRD